MKFGRNYHKHQIADWADAYMNYAVLKRLCKESTASTNLRGKSQIWTCANCLFPRALHETHDSDLLEYLELAERCTGALNTTNQFYCNNYAILLLKLSPRDRLRDPYYDIHTGFTGHFDVNRLDYIELQHQKTAFLELVAEFDKLRWYGRINTDGFRKIIHKLRFLGTNGAHVAVQVETTLCRLEFATQAQCLGVLGNLYKVIALITRAQQNLPKERLKVKDSFCIQHARVNPSIPALLLFRAIENDDPLELGRLVDNICKGELDFSRTEFFHVLFQCSIRCSYHSWVDVLISRAISQDAVVVIENGFRNVIAGLCWNTQQANPSDYRTSLSLLTYMLDRLLDRKLDLLNKQDHLGRIPLHYACECDSAEVCGTILKSMEAWEQLGVGNTKSAILLKDMQSRSPIQISVLSGNLKVTETLIHFECRNSRSDLAALRPCFSAAISKLLLFSIKSNHTEAIACLLKFDADVNCSDVLGQTPLYLAARSGNKNFISLLLRHKAVVDRAENTKNWTPLIIACLAGFATIAEVLLKHGANIEHRDHAGWTAIDHASYRGHIPLAKALSKAAADLSHKQAAELQRHLKTSSQRKLLERGQRRRTVSTAESYVVVNLGSMDSSTSTPPVYLNPHLIENPSIIHPESLFSLGVSMLGTTNPTYTIPLPLLEDATNKPWVFTTIEPMNAKLVFEVFRNVSANAEGRELVGRGMALLDSYERSHATKREILSRDLTIPILSMGGLEYIGAVIFSFIISTPLVLPNTPLIDTEALWYEHGPSKVVGHRVMYFSRSFESFLCRDVQLTKDHVPVIYHDFIVSETGIDSPMYTITHEQFMHISNEQSDQRLSAVPCEADTAYFKTPLSRKVRTLSVNASDGVETKAFMARVKHTVDYNSRGCKGNTRGDFIHDPFVTFEQLLRNLPSNIPLNIEIKYPMLSEIVEWNMDPFFIEANFFTDTILMCLSKHISTRAVILSSFSPDICILLARKQARWPVFFCNDSGNSQQNDVRAQNLQEAVNFAKKWELDGVVLASEPFVLAPQLVGFVKGKGMVCATYGELNDEVEGVTIQAMTGVDILIVNEVRLVSETVAAIGHECEDI